MNYHEICWNIWRLGSKETLTKMAGTNCPCHFDPVNNPLCPKYEPVRFHSCGCSSEVEHPVANGEVGDNRKLSSAPPK